VLVFTLVLSFLTGTLFGLAPALQASRASLSEALKEGGSRPTSGFRRRRVGSLLVISEVALARRIGRKPPPLTAVDKCADQSLPFIKLGESNLVGTIFQRQEKTTKPCRRQIP
jgi:hypothetical protein